jgi:hypothetical protein
MWLLLKDLFVKDRAKIPAVATLGHSGNQLFQAARIDPAQAIGDLFRARNLESLPFLNGLDKSRGFDE